MTASSRRRDNATRSMKNKIKSHKSCISEEACRVVYVFVFVPSACLKSQLSPIHFPPEAWFISFHVWRRWRAATSRKLGMKALGHSCLFTWFTYSPIVCTRDEFVIWHFHKIGLMQRNILQQHMSRNNGVVIYCHNYYIYGNRVNILPRILCGVICLTLVAEGWYYCKKILSSHHLQYFCVNTVTLLLQLAYRGMHFFYHNKNTSVGTFWIFVAAEWCYI